MDILVKDDPQSTCQLCEGTASAILRDLLNAETRISESYPLMLSRWGFGHMTSHAMRPQPCAGGICIADISSFTTTNNSKHAYTYKGLSRPSTLYGNFVKLIASPLLASPLSNVTLINLRRGSAACHHIAITSKPRFRGPGQILPAQYPRYALAVRGAFMAAYTGV